MGFITSTRNLKNTMGNYDEHSLFFIKYCSYMCNNIIYICTDDTVGWCILMNTLPIVMLVYFLKLKKWLDILVSYYSILYNFYVFHIIFHLFVT